MSRLIEKAANIIPSERQYNWQTTEFYAFVHFGVNTFTDREWGDGKENPEIFNPVKFDANQWVEAIKEAGMRGLILTCKHHDGFCLWPSKYTEHSVKNSPYKSGSGDIVREVAEACEKGGIKFGVYLSPWDRHEQSYGDSPMYNQYFVNQLKELLTQYGPIFSVWFDGACAEGPNGKLQEYDWDAYYSVIRECQPGAAISVCGPDVRWCGNEGGYTRKAEWSVVPKFLSDVEKIAAKSQQIDDGEFSRRVTNSDEDLGSREFISHVDELIWYPCETNTSIRPGWFYHKHEDDKIRSLDDLMNVYYKSVGGNSTFLLNIPPDKNGLFHENDVKRLKEIGERLKKDFGVNFAENIEPNIKTDGETAEISIRLNNKAEISKFVLMEDIKNSGQRVEEYEIYADGELLYKGQTIGYKKIAILEKPVKTDNVLIKITQSRISPNVSFIGVY